jgi:diguanylate cyclase (GGDEF)-like protein
MAAPIVIDWRILKDQFYQIESEYLIYSTTPCWAGMPIKAFAKIANPSSRPKVYLNSFGKSSAQKRYQSMINEFNFYELKVAERLPSPSGTALAIVKLVQRDDASMSGVAQLVKTDPALTGRIERFVNSAAFGARRPIVDVQDAVMMMGMQAVRNFTLSLSLIGNNSTGKCSGFDYASYWSQSLAVGVAIAAITERERTVSPGESFTLGLLSEVGRLALATAWPEVYGECLATAEGEYLLDLEIECFAIDHNALSVILLEDWGLPQLFLDALRLSFDTGINDTSRVARLASQLAFARLIARYCKADDSYRASLLTDLKTQASFHHLGEATLIDFVDGVIEEWHEWGKLIEIDTTIQESLPKVTSAEITLSGLDLLLVDDDTLKLAHLSKQLTEAGNRVWVCRNSKSALQYVIEHKPQIVIIERHLNPSDGIALCKSLRTSSIGKNLYLIMFSDTENEDILIEALDAGIDDYVTKPISLRVLLARIRSGHRTVMLQQTLEKESRDTQRYIAEVAAANRRLRILANTDILTGLPNRRYALERLEQEWATAQRYKQPMSILMLDLDHFKSVNDSFGHDVGDLVLAHAAKLMKETSRSNDVVCRLGGEEFLIIAPNTDGNTALLLGERIRSAIEKTQCKKLAQHPPMTVSIGVAGSLDDKLGWKALMKLADQALYSVKYNNRNGVQLGLIK